MRKPRASERSGAVGGHPVSGVAVRRQLRDGDVDAMARFHTERYAAEFGLDERFAESVHSSIEAHVQAGWTRDSGAVWLIDGDPLGGSLALTDEGHGLGQVRWFLLAPELRGRGLGRSLIAELIAEAQTSGFDGLELATFSALTTAARIYRDAGFRLRSAEETDMWGPPIVLQRYELALH